MADFYKVLKADPLGDPWESHGKMNQTYWCQVEGQDRAVSISKNVDNKLYPGQHIYGDLMYAKSQKGTEYWKLKSAQVPEGVQRPSDSPAPAPQAQGQDVGGQVPAWAVPMYNMVEYIYKEMKKMDTDAEPEPVVHQDHSDNMVVDEPSDMPPDFLKVDDPATPPAIKTVFGE